MEEKINNFKKVHTINICNIVINRDQPRVEFDRDNLIILRDSILQHGLLQPIIVKEIDREKYEIIAGERRFRACILAGIEEIDVIIKNVNNKNTDIIALIENIHRENLTPIEEAKCYEKIISSYDMTQKQLSKILGMTQPSLANKLRLLKLSPNIQTAILKRKITERHGRSLLTMANLQEREKIFSKIIERNLTVAETEKIINLSKKVKAKNNEKNIRFSTGIAHNYKLAINTLNYSVKTLSEFGFDPEFIKSETDQEIVFKIKINKVSKNKFKI